MAERSESTPFLADNDHVDDYDPNNFSRVLPANAHFKKPLRVLSGVISFLSLGVFGLLIASYVLLNVGPFQYIWGSKEVTRDLSIVVSPSIASIHTISLSLLCLSLNGLCFANTHPR